MEIIWKRFRDTPYSVSDNGEVMNDINHLKLVPSINTAGYYTLHLRDGMYMIHQMVGEVFLGYKPNGRTLVVHHKDNNKLNNNVNNLEIITFRKNCSIERTIKSSSQYVGVSWCNTYKKWRAAIRIKGKLKFLGYHKEELDAHKAYQNALKELK